MFGAKSCTIDAKGRVFIPAKFRDEMGEELVVFKALDGAKCLFVVSRAEWDELTAKISALPFSQAKQFERYIYPAAADLSCDAQGRALLPADLRQHASLSDGIKINGTGKRLEIWSAGDWESEQQKHTDENMAALIDEIGF